MVFAQRNFMHRFMAIYAVVAVCFIGLNNAHIHLSEAHTADDHHHHDAEYHAAHPVSHHDNLAGGADHPTDASFVELDPVGNLVHGVDDGVRLVALFVVLSIVAPVAHAVHGRRMRDRRFRIDTPLGARPGARGPP